MNGNDDNATAGRIVVGVDGSEASKDALRWAGRQAELTGASLEVVITWSLFNGAGYYEVPLPMDEYGFEPQARRRAEEAIDEILGDHPGVKVSVVVVEAYPAPALLKRAVGADALVLGSRGHGAFTGMVLGSVSQHCVSHAPCPVVVVRHSSRPAEVHAG